MGIDWENIYEKIMYELLYVKFFDYKQITNNSNIINIGIENYKYIFIIFMKVNKILIL
jgi:hypothetical protein